MKLTIDTIESLPVELIMRKLKIFLYRLTYTQTNTHKQIKKYDDNLYTYECAIHAEAEYDKYYFKINYLAS